MQLSKKLENASRYYRVDEPMVETIMFQLRLYYRIACAQNATRNVYIYKYS